MGRGRQKEESSNPNCYETSICSNKCQHKVLCGGHIGGVNYTQREDQKYSQRRWHEGWAFMQGNFEIFRNGVISTMKPEQRFPTWMTLSISGASRNGSRGMGWQNTWGSTTVLVWRWSGARGTQILFSAHGRLAQPNPNANYLSWRTEWVKLCGRINDYKGESVFKMVFIIFLFSQSAVFTPQGSTIWVYTVHLDYMHIYCILTQLKL